MSRGDDWNELSREAWTVPGKSGELPEEHILLQLHNTRTFGDLRNDILELNELFESSGIKLEVACDLRRQLIETLAYIGGWERGEEAERDWLVSLRSVDTVIGATLPLRELPLFIRRKYLAPLASGSLHPLARTKSNAKNILWELALWSICRARGFHADLAEPDILLSLGSNKLGISCKKVYSEKTSGKCFLSE